ncbi:Protein of unkown function DUF3268 [uncultured Caudovirales phage]|uniref:Protein of unkown function DUF3268 n=1 Tax=uncultured Caudovirales phage TaxID=2100421 RepID=A0A6J5KRL0_9CAUD|nr:Protein of unkown function DUF3268 [uncultured Caudovirales phage]
MDSRVMAPRCNYCARPSRLVSGAAIYPHRPDLFGKWFYQCKPCDAYVGCHKGGVPLGDLANRELRKTRRVAHSVFDRLWKEGDLNRSQAYAWMSEAMGLPPEKAHIGMFSVEQCRALVNLVAARGVVA